MDRWQDIQEDGIDLNRFFDDKELETMTDAQRDSYEQRAIDFQLRTELGELVFAISTYDIHALKINKSKYLTDLTGQPATKPAFMEKEVAVNLATLESEEDTSQST